MARNIVLTDLGSAVQWSETVNGIVTTVQLPKTAYQVQRETNTFSLIPLNGMRQMGEFVNADLATPYADADALEAALLSFFGLNSYTAAELSTAISSGILPTGKWIFVSTIWNSVAYSAERGIWLFCSSTSTVSKAGFGNFQNCNWQDVTADYTDIEAVSGVAFGGTNLGQWSIANEEFTINYSGIVNGPFSADEPVSNGLGWEGHIVSVTPARITVYTTLGTQPSPSDTITMYSTTATVTVVGARALQSQVVCWLDQTTHTYQHYQCFDDTQLNGTAPDQNDLAYVVLPRKGFLLTYTDETGAFQVGDSLDDGTMNGWKVSAIVGADQLFVYPNSGKDFPEPNCTLDGGTATATLVSVGSNALNFGYLSVEGNIEFDVENLWLSMRYDGSNRVYSPYATNPSYNPITSFQWGKNGISNNEICNLLVNDNSQAAEFSGNTFETLSETVLVCASNSQFVNNRIETGTTVDLTISESVIISNMTVRRGLTYTGKTANTSLSNFIVTQDDTTTTSIILPQFDFLGNRTQFTTISSDQCLNVGSGNLSDGIVVAEANGAFHRNLVVGIKYNFVASDYTGPAIAIYSGFGGVLLNSLPITNLCVGENAYTELTIGFVPIVQKQSERMDTSVVIKTTTGGALVGGDGTFEVTATWYK
jgi:hypothetical protein